MTKNLESPTRKSLTIMLLSAVLAASGSAAISLKEPGTFQTMLSSVTESMGGFFNQSSGKYENFEIAAYPVLDEFVNRYTTLEELLTGLEADLGLIYDLEGDQNFYGEFSFNESPLVLLTKAKEKRDFTYQCFERAELVALWAEQRFGFPPLILSFYTNDSQNLAMNHSVYVFKENDKWGYMSDDKEFTKPQYHSLEDLADEWMATHGSPDKNCDDAYVQWMLVDLRKIFSTRGDWRIMEENIQLYMRDVVKHGQAVS